MTAPYPNGGTPPTTITEDSPAWNCHTMGNRICGKVANSLPFTGGDIAIVAIVGIVLLTLGVLAVRWGKKRTRAAAAEALR